MADVPGMAAAYRYNEGVKLPPWNRERVRLKPLLAFFSVALVLAGSGVALILTLPEPTSELSPISSYPPQLRAAYSLLVKDVQDFEIKQAQTHSPLTSKRDLEQMLSRVQLDAGSGQFRQALADINATRTLLKNLNLELAGGTRPAPQTGATGVTFLPIVLYHYTPPNFDQQLSYLEGHHYTVIDMDQALAGMHGGPLPAKPVVLTFDDGFADQMRAFEMLKQHNMRATFYIIDGGAESRWCIGAGRRYGDPSQPPGGCGDAYLTWDQVRQLDRSGLITIGGHTVNHRNLATLSAADQQFEIAQGKTMLEQELGHGVRHFAYPYGTYNATSIAIAQAAGYATAVTTQPGNEQPAGSEFTLRRIRDTLSLP
jgi:peptidoglycan/xylan/chitin deacetylase (PgdA/CDA1 family)